MASADGRWQLVFNGEIYNFRELRQQLVASGVSFRGQSDTEVLLALWQQRGASPPSPAQWHVFLCYLGCRRARASCCA